MTRTTRSFTAGPIALCGMAMGWMTAPSGIETVAVQAADAQGQSRGGSTPLAALRRSPCQDAVAERLAQIEELRRAAYGDPTPFPADLEQAFTPEAVEDRARRVMTECPELGWTLHMVDCTEYPCITVWDGPDLDGAGLEECPAWGGVRAQGTMAHMTFMHGADGVRRQLVALTQYTPAPDDTWNVVQPGGRASRFDLRTQPALDELKQLVGPTDEAAQRMK